MSAISLTLLVAAGLSAALCGATLYTARSLRTEVAALRAELRTAPRFPLARTAPDEELIRAAVADALADERERELAEARAFWAEQELREGQLGHLLAGRCEPDMTEVDEALLDALLDGCLPGESGIGGAAGAESAAPGPGPGPGTVFLPRQGRAASGPEPGDGGDAGESAELAAARRRHPSNPGYTLSGEPVDPAAARAADAEHGHDREEPGDGGDGGEPASTEEEQARTAGQLARLAEDRTPLADVRPGPLGTLDVYLFADGTTVCLSPGHRETAERLADALRAGTPPVLLGGSGVSGAYALTFACGEESVYLLADRVVTA
ncbi:hypothetical protein [Streptomyces sp. YIM 98790]|uniref:hypothetical protein n=1 Tax=Streptomyces sp. YIM 98790 TaxID=2689077 RepID=UPI0014081FD9|nr:hypothetical protein [Streptomyces sp. YIM 98790]